MAKILRTNKSVLFRHSFNYLFNSNNTSINCCFSTQNVKQFIQIPKRIERGPTDILRALADITQRDMSAPDYHYVDDPFLTPLSGHQKRVFALSRESGRRAANYVFEEFPELFFRDLSEPKIEAFTYKDIYDENTEVDENDLKLCIARKEVNHSMVCYKNLIRDSVEINSQTLQKLLELICFHNSEEPPDLQFIIEKTFVKESDIPRIVWKDNGFAEQLFSSMADKTSQSYCALIQGMAKYSQSQKAYQYYQEMIEKGFKLNVETYNSILKCTPLLRESVDSRWLFVEEILNCMKQNEIKPNLQTLNTILEIINRFGTFRFAQNLAKKTLVEMTSRLGIEPSLATYYHILNIFGKQRGSVGQVLHEIMERIDGQEFEIRDPKDVNFFVNAMSVCNFTSDLEMAYKIHKLLNTGHNYRLLGSVLNESNYYQKFFQLLSLLEDIKRFMELYDRYVPHIYIPEPNVFYDILKSIELYEAYDYMPCIWDDLNQFENTTNINLMEELFRILSKPTVDQKYRKQFSEMVTEGITQMDARIKRRLKEGHFSMNQLSGTLLGYAIEVYLNNDDMDSAIKIVEKILSEKDNISGNPSSKSLIRLSLKAIDNKMYSLAKHCVHYCTDLGMFEVSDRVLSYVRELDLDSKIKEMFEKACNISELVSNQPISGEDSQTTDQMNSKST